jgi:predicted RNA-binding Zn-ribbon protein involved in translation (DUF1610 family)
MSGYYEEARRMLVRAIAEIKGGEHLTARRYLERLIHIPSTSEQKAEAFYRLSEIAESEEEELDYLQSALGYDMTHHRARRKMAILRGELKQSEIIDPDKFIDTTQEGIQDREGKRFECPTCGSRMVFSPDGETLICEYCAGQSAAKTKKELEEQAFLIGISTAKGHQKARATQSFECDACGAVFILAPETLSFTCPHCDSTYTIEQAEVRDLILPEGIIPMKIDRHRAEQLIREWFQKQYKDLPFLQIETLEGIYLPAWTFDLSGFIKWTGLQENQNQQTIRVQDSRSIHFDDVFIPASRHEPKHLSRLVKNFNADDVKPFHVGYLADWLAESYQVTMADAAVRARDIAFKLAQKQQRSRTGNLQNLRYYSDDILIESYKLVLIPVYLAHIRLETELIEVLVDGKTGEVYAKKPPGFFRKTLDWLLDD